MLRNSGRFGSRPDFLCNKIQLPAGSLLAASVGSDRKGAVSTVIYMVAIPLAFVRPWMSCACYVLVAVMWLVPDRRIEKTLAKRTETD